MKHIAKNNSSQFQKWKSKIRTNTYGQMSPQEKKSLRGFLCTEQGYLCCYCEQRITIENSHVEHICPQHLCQQQSLEYTNVLCSCIKVRKKNMDLHCGHRKNDWYDPRKFISPLEPSCEQRFCYSHAGQILPANIGDMAAQETIARLGLNEGDLPKKRKMIIDMFYGIDIPNGITEGEMQQFAQKYLLLRSDKTYNEFWTVIQFFSNNRSQS